MLIQEIAMNVLEKSLLPEVVGGSVYDSGTGAMADGGGGGGYGGGYGGGSDFNWGFFGDSFASAGGFDSNGVGANSCVPAASASGLFGYTFTETLAGAGALTGLATGLGQGVGASLAIEAAGGWAGVGGMGSSAAGLIGSATLGLVSAAAVGGLIGTIAYNGSETVRDLSQAAVGQAFEVIEAFKEVGATVFGIDRTHQPVYHP
jgi:hypothetical protein